IWSIQAIILLLMMAVMICFPEAVIEFFTFWDEDADPEKYAQARSYLVWMAPALLCLSLGSTTYILLNGYKRFFLAAFGDSSWKICVLLSLAVGIGVLGMGPQ